MITLTEKAYNMIDIWRKRNPDENCACKFSNFMSAENALKVWSNAKEKYLYNLMGKELILKRHIKIEKPLSLIMNEYEDLRYKSGSPIREFMNALERKAYWSNIDYNFWNDVLTNENVCQNRIVKFRSPQAEIRYNNHKLIIGGEDFITIQKGMKVMKLLGKLANHFSLTEEFEKYRLEHSRLLNDKYIEGDLCLSIHPLDYMTMSDNTYNWSSCMNWNYKGCFRAGTVEMMNSPCVVVAYLEGADDFLQISRYSDAFPWNSKKWRELFIVHKDIITGVKGYPYHNEEIEKIAGEWLRELAEKNLGWDYTDRTLYYACPRWYLVPKEGFPARTAKFQTNAMYNDFYHDCYNDTPRYAYFGDKTSVPNINYSGERQCMWCGETFDLEFAHEGEISCLNCSDSNEIMCYCCKETYEKDDLILLEDGTWMCRCCYEDNLVTLLSGENVYGGTTVYLRVVNEEPSNRYDKISSADSSCYAHIAFKKTDTPEDWAQHFNIPAPHFDFYNVPYVFACECKEEVIQKIDSETKPF